MPIFEVTFKQQHRGEAIDGFFFLVERCARFTQHAFGLGRRQAFIPIDKRQPDMIAQPFRELASVFALAALVTAHMQGTSDKKQADISLSNNCLQRGKILANSRAAQRFDTLRGDAKLVADGETDALPADVERQNSACYGLLLRVCQIGL